MNLLAQEWLKKAEDGLQAAKWLLQAPIPNFDAVCFHAQQCAEKCLKALLQEQMMALTVREREQRVDGVGRRTTIAPGKVEVHLRAGAGFGRDEFVLRFKHAGKGAEVEMRGGAFGPEQFCERARLERGFGHGFEFGDDRRGGFEVQLHEHGAVVAHFAVDHLLGEREAGGWLARQPKLFEA